VISNHIVNVANRASTELYMNVLPTTRDSLHLWKPMSWTCNCTPCLFLWHTSQRYSSPQLSWSNIISCYHAIFTIYV